MWQIVLMAALFMVLGVCMIGFSVFTAPSFSNLPAQDKLPQAQISDSTDVFYIIRGFPTSLNLSDTRIEAVEVGYKDLVPYPALTQLYNIADRAVPLPMSRMGIPLSSIGDSFSGYTIPTTFKSISKGTIHGRTVQRVIRATTDRFEISLAQRQNDSTIRTLVSFGTNKIEELATENELIWEEGEVSTSWFVLTTVRNDVTSSTMEIYVNGRILDATAPVDVSIWDFADTVVFGGADVAAVLVYEPALTDAQVKSTVADILSTAIPQNKWFTVQLNTAIQLDTTSLPGTYQLKQPAPAFIAVDANGQVTGQTPMYATDLTITILKHGYVETKEYDITLLFRKLPLGTASSAGVHDVVLYTGVGFVGLSTLLFAGIWWLHRFS